MSAYQKRHYEAIAELVKGLTVYSARPRRSTEPHVSLFDLVEAMAELFTADNPLFDRDRFFEAVYRG